jgi:hypothetical protein
VDKVSGRCSGGIVMPVVTCIRTANVLTHLVVPVPLMKHGPEEPGR